MPRLSHGGTISLERVQAALQAMVDLGREFPVALAAPRTMHRFDYLFPQIQDDAFLLPQGPETIRLLTGLGETMHDQANGGDSSIPAPYTYLGQFIDHDITLELESDRLGRLDNPLILEKDDLLSLLQNLRTGTLDLDSVYAPPAPQDPNNASKMELGTVVSGVPRRPPKKDDFNDVPREARNADPLFDRAARIGDGRNDENLVVSQLHVAFLRAHNNIVGNPPSRDLREAQRVLRQLYQWVILRDFLPRISDPSTLQAIRANGNRFYHPRPDDVFMPLEFSGAAYRFGHSMVRADYDFNLNFRQATLGELFTFTALSGQLGGFERLPENWIIQWEDFFRNPARKIDTLLVEPLFELRNLEGKPIPDPIMGRLAVRNLLRGYRLRLPTGQAVAAAIGVPAIDIKSAVTDIPAQVQYFDSAFFADGTSVADRTPLWFYILAEASKLGGGDRLGPVGTTIVAEVFLGLLSQSEDSILAEGAGWNPSLLGDLGQVNLQEFNLIELLKLAGVFG